MSLYTFTQKFLKAGFRLFYSRVHISGLHHIPEAGPVLLVANHPNSFMDALVIGAYLKRPLNFLARGDAFNNPVLRKIFKAYNMLPVYRISEGKENIEKNFDTFDACYNAVEQNQMILIFGEGLCKNNYDLRPLKKGPARIAQRAWNSNGHSSELAIVPVGLTYQHFDGPGKSLIINYGAPVTKNDLAGKLNAPDFTQQLNAKLAVEIEKLCYVNPSVQTGSAEHKKLAHIWYNAESENRNVLEILKGAELSRAETFSRSIIKSCIHASAISLPHYWVSKAVTKKLTAGSVFYDSILFGLYWFLLPLYLLALTALILYFI
jgi:1-acyl-sn-glycerol-3-phosphate acyltransferase